MANNGSGEGMQESWVEVQEQQERGTLTHTSSKEEMKQLLASAASEEEELSDSDVIYQVTFQTSDEIPQETTQVPFKKPTRQASKQVQYRPQIPPVSSIPKSRVAPGPNRTFGDGICSLTFLVPVIILTHLAMFGLGYYLGRRWMSDPSTTVMKLFHV